MPGESASRRSGCERAETGGGVQEGRCLMSDAFDDGGRIPDVGTEFTADRAAAIERLVPPAFLRKRECVCRCVQICCPGASSRCRISICGPRCRRKRTEPLKSETMQEIRAYLQPGKAACSTYPHSMKAASTARDAPGSTFA